MYLSQASRLFIQRLDVVLYHGYVELNTAQLFGISVMRIEFRFDPVQPVFQPFLFDGFVNRPLFSIAFVDQKWSNW